MTTKNLIQYTITTTNKPNEYGQYILTFKVNGQDPKQVATHLVDLTYKAKNGYTIISGVAVTISSEKKRICLLGSMERGIYGTGLGRIAPTDIDWEGFKTREEMESFKKDIIEAINDWAENGGFDTSHIQHETYEA